MRVERLSSFPWIVARIGCGECPRTGRYRLARLAVAFGAEAKLNEVLLELSADCPIRLEHERGHRSTSCAACFVDLTSSNPPPPDLPGSLRRLEVIDGGRKEPAPAKRVVPRYERNPRRAYERDGTEIEPGRIGSMVAHGITRVRVFCPLPCWHTTVMEVSDWPAGMPVANIALRLRCSKCGRHGQASIMPDWPNPIPQKQT